MIAAEFPWLLDALVAVAYAALFWMLGVGWAAYRALSWAERINSWAQSVPCDQEEVTS